MIDIILVLIMLGYAISGFRQGLVVGLLSLGGFVGGALLAMFFVPQLVSGLEQGTRRSIITLLAVIFTAWAGQFIGAMIGGRIRQAVPEGPVALADHIVGAGAGVLAVALVLWFVAGAVRGGPSEQLSRTVAESKVIATIDDLVPTGLVGVADRFREAVGSSNFPRVFAGVEPEDIAPVEAPDQALTQSEAVSKARRAVVKITGEANSCGRGQEGSGAVIAPQRVVTNAHVVAGVDEPRVQVGGEGKRYRARVVAFDPVRDLAVLAVPKLPVEPLQLTGDLERGDDAVVVGFPNDGPFKVSPARVRSIVRASGEDIYGNEGAIREVYSLYVKVRPGNSGGPVLDPAGNVVGVVFAKSLDDPNTGYALTMDEARETIEAGAGQSKRVDSGECAQG
ncbi:MarP family serine protease [Kineosporia rhizophila]|uniref:MarP family serine protease n=1 Tax=Kineosporia TaxID=49184 RepID=UPI001E5A5F70|nr:MULTISPECIES: MarP family serine protease [Kineosporia]MCE0536015.1 MarP family serine protease [Kineosporia rhizophila]GLY14148.1 serine protease [Kineosporia sp. NBRC 101677]